MLQKIAILLFKACRRGQGVLKAATDKLYCRWLFYCQNVHHVSFRTKGIPYVSIALGGICEIGQNFQMNNTLASNPIGRPQRCILFVTKEASLKIGDNVGISQAALVCHAGITIGNNVKIGGGVCIYDTDFHSLDPNIRKNDKMDFLNKKKSPVVVKNNAFIGAHSIILKGVTIGENAVVGAGSVITKNVPDNEIWAGNPAKKIGSIY